MIHESARATRKTHRFSVGEFLLRIAKPLFVTLLAVLLFLLGQAMVRHRFFQGSRYRDNGTVGQ
jgi:hypothetical protein